MFKAVWMSDLHFTWNDDVLGHDPRIRLRRAIRHINDTHSDAHICVISGDMVNRGTMQDYQALRQELDTLAVPYAPMVGNHDDCRALRETLPLPDTCMADFVQYCIETPEGILACLDTQRAGSDAGEFCKARSDWLRRIATQYGDLPLFLFLHHPPMALGLPMQDSENMVNGADFLNMITQIPSVRYMFIGHVHRPISGTIKGIGYSTMRSVLYQAPAPRPAWNWDSFAPAEEAPNIGIITITDGDVNLQYEQFCTYETGTLAG